MGVLRIFFFCILGFSLSVRGWAQEVNPERPSKIVSINLCTDELLLQLVEPERVAAVSPYADNPKISTVADKAKNIRKIQGSVEGVLSCQPDLLLGGTFSPRETLHFFQYSDIPVLIFGIPKGFSDIYADIRKLARATGNADQGERMIEKMKGQLDSCVSKALQKKRAVFFQSGNYVPGAETFENAIMEAAGLENVAATLGIHGYGTLSLEKLSELKPEILIFSNDQTQAPTVRGEVLSHPIIRKAMPNVKAVTLPAALLNCGSPASVRAVELLVQETSGSKC